MNGRCSIADDDSSEVQIKNTRFKKVSQFLSYCTSDECGRLLSTREENGVTMIASVQRAHELFKGAKVNDPEAFKAAVLSKIAFFDKKNTTFHSFIHTYIHTCLADDGESVLQWWLLLWLSQDIYSIPISKRKPYIHACIHIYIHTHSSSICAPIYHWSDQTQAHFHRVAHK